MREERLLERIRSWQQKPERRAREDPRRTIDSILRHLTRILNTKQGNVPIAEDYGIPDFTDFATSYLESVGGLERSLRQVIQRYEPRLKVQRVSFVPQEEGALSLRFDIVARLATSGEKVPVHFETVVDTNGKVSISG
jgi:type VI secretion system protein